MAGGTEAEPILLVHGSVIKIQVKASGQVLLGRVVAVAPEHVGDGRYAFKILAEPLD
jgi:hypothetical protein